MEENRFFPIKGSSDDFKIGGADHEVDVGERLVDAKGMKFVFAVLLEIRVKISKTAP